VTPDFLADMSRDLFLTAFLVAGPPLTVGLLVGLTVSLMQAVTQINEMTLAFIPKIAAIGGTLLIGTPWMLRRITEFTIRILDELPRVVH
jgi:flagellar biosynthetic protein FliQ